MPVNDAAAAETVYIIDDEPSVAGLIESILLEEGFEVFVSYSADDTLDELEDLDRTVDLFIIDVVLPDMSGPDLALEITRRRPGASILFISGYGSGAELALRRSTPDALFLPKPFDPEAMVAAVHQALDGKPRSG